MIACRGLGSKGTDILTLYKR